MDSADITIRANSASSDHATIVARLMVGENDGIVPDAKLYCTQITDSLFDDIDWLLDQGVNVINMSNGVINGGQYDDAAEWIDHIASYHSVHFVCAAGNYYSINGFDLFTPATAYNTLTVGSYDDNNTPTNHTDDDFSATFSCFEEASSTQCNNPKLLAPGENIFMSGVTGGLSGTSISAPLTTAVVAQLIDYSSSLATKQTAVNAILMASAANKADDSTYTDSASDYQVSDSEGVGEIDSRWARGIAYYSNWWTATVYSSSFPYSVTDYVNASSSSIRVSFLWLKRNSETSEIQLTDLDLRVYDPNGNFVDSSLSTYNNYEVLEFDPTVSGYYTFKVFRYGTSSSTKEHLAIAKW